MLKYGNKRFEDEAEIRKSVQFATVPQLNGSDEWGCPTIAGVITPYQRDSVLRTVTNPLKAKKATLVNAYVKYIVAGSKQIKTPTTFEELKEAVIRETMAYDGCYSGKKDWLESVGIEAPPSPLQVELRFTNLPDVGNETELADYLLKHLPEGVEVEVDSVVEYDDY
jgi:hypothetical protein